MVIIDKGYIILKFKQAMFEKGFVGVKITTEEVDAHLTRVKYEDMEVFSLVTHISAVNDGMPPTIFVHTKTMLVNMIELCKRADELLMEKTKIFLN